MRKITPGQIGCFVVMQSVILGSAGGTTWLLTRWLPLGAFTGVFAAVAFLTLTYLFAFAVYRAFLKIAPLERGALEVGSRGEFVAQVNILFYLMFFNTLIRTNVLPVPIGRLVYLALGARLGDNTFSAGAILDPPLTTMGNNCIVGHNATIFAHAIEGYHFALHPVEIGDNVTIGANATIMSDVVIEDGAIVCAGAVVTKGTRIGRDEIWGGLPARCLGMRRESVRMGSGAPARVEDQGKAA